MYIMMPRLVLWDWQGVVFRLLSKTSHGRQSIVHHCKLTEANECRRLVSDDLVTYPQYTGGWCTG